MKSMVEHMTSMIILFIMMLVFSSIIACECQVINARNYHTLMVEKLQNEGYYTNDLVNKYIDDYKEEGFDFVLLDTKIEVNYTYDIYIPLIGTIEQNNIVGYAR